MKCVVELLGRLDVADFSMFPGASHSVQHRCPLKFSSPNQANLVAISKPHPHNFPQQTHRT